MLTVERTMKTRRDAFPIQISNRVAVDSFRQYNRRAPATDSRDKCLLILTARQCHHGFFSPSPDVPWS